MRKQAQMRVGSVVRASGWMLLIVAGPVLAQGLAPARPKAQLAALARKAELKIPGELRLPGDAAVPAMAETPRPPPPARRLAQAPSPAPAPAAPPAKKVVKLVYTLQAGASGCPAARATEEAVAARLGYNPFKPSAKEVIEVAVTVEKSGGMSAVLRLRDEAGAEKGMRELFSTSRDCGELASSLQLAIALAVDPQSFIGGPTLAAVEEPAPLPPPPPPPPLLVSSPEPAPSSLRFSAGLGVVGLAGSSPDVTGGLELRLSLSGERFSISLDARADLPRELSFAPGGASVSTMIASVAPCYHFYFAGVCAVAGAGAVRISSFDLDNSRSVTSPLVVGGARVRADWNFARRFALAFSVDGLAPITRTVLTVSDRPVWSAPPLMVVGGVLLVVHVI